MANFQASHLFAGAGNDDDKTAEFRKMLAENEAMWLGTDTCHTNCSDDATRASPNGNGGHPTAGLSDASSPTLVTADAGDVERLFEEDKTSRADSIMSHLPIQATDETQELRQKNQDLSNTVEKITEQLKTVTQAHSEALVQVRLGKERLEHTEQARRDALEQVKQRDEQLKAIASTHEETLKALKADRDQLGRLHSQVSSLQSEKQQLKESMESTSITKGHSNRISAMRDSESDRMKRLIEERFHLSDELLKSVRSQLNDKVKEIDTLKSTLTEMSAHNATKSDKLAAARAKLAELNNTIVSQRNEITALNSRQLATQPADGDQADFKLKRDVAVCIAHLDVLSFGHRVWTCSHEQLADIPDGSRATTDKLYPLADSLFASRSADQDFIQYYQRERQIMLLHHRAHDRADPGRAVRATEVRAIYDHTDGRRGVQVQYN